LKLWFDLECSENLLEVYRLPLAFTKTIFHKPCATNILPDFWKVLFSLLVSKRVQQPSGEKTICQRRLMMVQFRMACRQVGSGTRDSP
jgi:hypothetical protein